MTFLGKIFIYISRHNSILGPHDLTDSILILIEIFLQLVLVLAQTKEI